MTVEDRLLGGHRAIQAIAIGGIAAAIATHQRQCAAAAEIRITAVPAKVRETAKRILPSANWSTADKGKLDGQDTYELTGHEPAGDAGEGRKVILVVTSETKATELRKTIPPTAVPQTAWEAIAKKVPSLEVITAYEFRQGDELQQPTDGDLAYEVGGIYGQERHVIIEVTADGEINEMERQVGLNDPPKAVTTALKAKLPKFQATTVYEVSEDDAVAGYQFEGKRPKDKTEIDVFVSADGKEIEINDD